MVDSQLPSQLEHYLSLLSLIVGSIVTIAIITPYYIIPVPFFGRLLLFVLFVFLSLRPTLLSPAFSHSILLLAHPALLHSLRSRSPAAGGRFQEPCFLPLSWFAALGGGAQILSREGLTPLHHIPQN